MNIEILKPLLKRLGLTGFLETLESRLLQARDSSLTYEEFITLLLQDEAQRRDARNFIKRVSRAKFEEGKTLEGLQLSCYPVKEQQVIRELSCGNYLNEHQHILIMGPTGTGKTHLAQALGQQACRQGKSVRFIRAQALHHILTASRADNSWQMELKKFLSPKLLIIDDFGLQALTMTQSEDIYELIAERYLKGSFIFTSNRKIEAWMDLFPEKVMANAALDRLAHHAHHIVLTGESYRRKNSPMLKNSKQA
jgi:DNA replication protein DnaC